MLRRLLQSRQMVFSMRCLSSSDRPAPKLKITSNKMDRELEDALKIEASLFENSTINHEPVKVSEVIKNSKQSFVKKPHVTNEKTNASSTLQNLQKDKEKQKDSPPLIKDDDLGLEFMRLSLGDRQLSTLMTTVRSRKRRDKDREIVIEGRRLIEEALDCGLVPQTLIFSKKEELEKLKEKLVSAQQKHKMNLYLVRHHDLKTWSSLTTSPGLLAIFQRPSELPKTLGNQKALPITVICDNIREPNNLGSIIRTCAALPCKQIVVTKGCCDPWESKALRGGCGGQFRLHIKDDIDWSEVPLTIPPEVAHDCHIYIAESNLEKLSNLSQVSATNYSDLQQIGSHNVVIIGGETHGVSAEAYKFLSMVGSARGKCLYIPLAQGVDSLNVASALTLILFELRKHLLNKAINHTESSAEESKDAEKLSV